MTNTPPSLDEAEKEAREEFIAQAWNAAYQRAYPPERSYEEAEKAGRAAAKEWDERHAAAKS